MRVLTCAFRFRHRAAFGFVRLQEKNAKQLTQRYLVPSAGQTDTLLLFQEDKGEPGERLALIMTTLRCAETAGRRLLS